MKTKHPSTTTVIRIHRLALANAHEALRLHRENCKLVNVTPAAQPQSDADAIFDAISLAIHSQEMKNESLRKSRKP